MLGRRLICALAAIVLAASAAQAVPILNGGIGCKPLTRFQIIQAMNAATTAPSATQINNMLNLLATYENHICTSCKAPYTQALALTALTGFGGGTNGVAQSWPNYVLCQCAAGYGFSQTQTTVTGKGKSTIYYKTRYGCTKCPSGQTSTIVDQRGPRGGQIVTTTGPTALPGNLGGSFTTSIQSTILPFTGFANNNQARCVAVGK